MNTSSGKSLVVLYFDQSQALLCMGLQKTSWFLSLLWQFMSLGMTTVAEKVEKVINDLFPFCVCVIQVLRLCSAIWSCIPSALSSSSTPYCLCVKSAATMDQSSSRKSPKCIKSFSPHIINVDFGYEKLHKCKDAVQTGKSSLLFPPQLPPSRCGAGQEADGGRASWGS